MKQLFLTRSDYLQLHKELDVAHEMKFAEDDGYVAEMLDFISQLSKAVKKKLPVHSFNVALPVADALAGSDYTLGGTFSHLYHQIICGRVADGQV